MFTKFLYPFWYLVLKDYTHNIFSSRSNELLRVFVSVLWYYSWMALSPKDIWYNWYLYHISWYNYQLYHISYIKLNLIIKWLTVIEIVYARIQSSSYSPHINSTQIVWLSLIAWWLLVPSCYQIEQIFNSAVCSLLFCGSGILWSAETGFQRSLCLATTSTCDSARMVGSYISHYDI